MGNFSFLNSIRTRLTALFLLIFGMTLIFFCSVLYYYFVTTNQTNFDLALFNHAVDIANTINIDLFGSVSVDASAISGSGKAFPFSAGSTFLQLTDSDGRILARSSNLANYALPIDPQDWKQLFSARGPAWIARDIQVGKQPVTYRMLSYRSWGIMRSEYVLQIAVPTTLLEKNRLGLLTFFGIGIPLTLLVASLGGLFLSGRALSPVALIIEKIRRIEASNLTERLPLPATHDEIQSLSTAFNELLERLQRSFESQDRFIADASHELKTPLAILRGELDLLKGRTPDAGELQAFYQNSSHELDYLGRILENLLTLARIDAGAASLVMKPVRLDELLIELAAREKRLSLNLFGENFETQGDSDLLRSLFKNLIDNAIKFSPAGSKIDISLTELPGTIRAQITNAGERIPPQLIPHIFERFYRVPRTSNADKPGAGLGLAIVKKIADAHHAEISVTSSESGVTQFRLEIKKV
ncbi:MAG: ATP-binding protein [Oligoflexia bacterium]|nr:ATP-binding protein [Oligoflexia bacterium]